MHILSGSLEVLWCCWVTDDRGGQRLVLQHLPERAARCMVLACIKTPRLQLAAQPLGGPFPSLGCKLCREQRDLSGLMCCTSWERLS